MKLRPIQGGRRIGQAGLLHPHRPAQALEDFTLLLVERVRRFIGTGQMTH